jgi:hypothetical protein
VTELIEMSIGVLEREEVGLESHGTRAVICRRSEARTQVPQP